MQCCNGNLTRLELDGITFEKNDGIVVESHSLFPGVRTLILIDCTVSVKWFMKCHDLAELQLIDSHVTYNGARYQNCPSLETLKIEGSSAWVQKGLHLFLQGNGQLKSVEVLQSRKFYGSYVFYLQYVYGLIAEFVATSVEYLGIPAVGIPDFTRFVSLKRLQIVFPRINRNYEHRNRLLVNGVLEQLEIDFLDGCLRGSDPETIARISHIEKLKLHNMIPREGLGAGVLHIVENLNNLSELVIGLWQSVFNANAVLDLIQRAPNLQLLVLTFKYNCDNDGKLEITADGYRQMLNAVLRRPNGKSLQIVVLCSQTTSSGIDVTFPMESSLKITCLANETVAEIMNIRIGTGNQCVMTDEVLNKLRERGLLDPLPEIEL